MSGNEESNMWEYMDFCNGEIRVKPGRYVGGWLTLGCALIEWEFDEEWDDLTMGDIDYSNAVRMLSNNDSVVLIEGAESANDAFTACVTTLTKMVADYERSNNGRY